MKECIVCQKKFVPINSNQITCCKEHFIVHRKEDHREYCRSKLYKDYIKKYYSIDKNKERQKKYMKSYKQTDEYKETLKTEKSKEYFKKYNLWWNKTPQSKLNRLRQNLKRIAAKNSIIELFTPEEFMMKAMNCNGVCPCCNKLFDKRLHLLTLDHFYAVSRAHKDYLRTGIKRIYTIDDVGPLCKSCNSSKSTKLIISRNPDLHRNPKHLNTSETSLSYY